MPPRAEPPQRCAQASPDIQKYQTIHMIARTAPTFTRTTSMGITRTLTVRSPRSPLGAFRA